MDRDGRWARRAARRLIDASKRDPVGLGQAVTAVYDEIRTAPEPNREPRLRLLLAELTLAAHRAESELEKLASDPPRA